MVTLKAQILNAVTTFAATIPFVKQSHPAAKGRSSYVFLGKILTYLYTKTYMQLCIVKKKSPVPRGKTKKGNGKRAGFVPSVFADYCQKGRP